ncbi:MAG TPA: fructose-bisphosphatase class III [Spirochaetota bacterium]|nr:fructose-bisphosphatase class III [Spirochaetota bacterium]HPJ35383.1 fructose-bisphosphatase class III [Spirochaetota bacterium]
MPEEQCITSYHEIIRELAEIESRLETNIDTTLWISDPHGAGERFVSILKGRFGLVWRTAYEALPKTFSNEKLEHLDRIIKKERYIEAEDFNMERQDVISALVNIIRYKVQNVHDFDQIRGNFSRDVKILLENLILNFPVPNIVYENSMVADKVITSLAKIVKQVILGQIIVLGDVFDRGDEPDKILRILSQKDLKPFVKFVWGNHDILWMGAAAGNKSLIAEALRISVRYDNLDFLKRLGIDITKLTELSEKLYPGNITGNFKAKLEISKKMEKTLAMIQFKLEEETIKKYPQLDMDSRLNIENLAELLKTGQTSGLADTHFPTMILDEPLRLTEEESEVINDLVDQFVSSKQIRRLMEYLFKEGKLYHINNYIMNIHALVPSTKDGYFEELYGKKGKELLDHIEITIKDIGDNYLQGKEQEPFQLAMMFYLWCGPKSPLFGKDAMKTFERYFFRDKVTHKEKTLYWGKNIENPEFISRLMDEFNVERIVFGHTPVDISKGQKIATPDGKAINIDGGFSEAYLNRGHSLIQTPYALYAIILPTSEEIIDLRKKKEPNRLMFEMIDTFPEPKKVKDTYAGKQQIKRRDFLLDELKKFRENKG